MKNKSLLWAITILIFLFVFGSAYYWYVYFLDLNNDGIINNNGNEQGKLVLTSENSVNKTDEKSQTTANQTPSYNFYISNEKNINATYSLYLQEIKPSEVNDGCTSETTLKKSQLDYELKLNGMVIKNGVLSDLENNLLDQRSINKSDKNKYDLIIWINKSSTEWHGKHFHYAVTIEEDK